MFFKNISIVVEQCAAFLILVFIHVSMLQLNKWYENIICYLDKIPLSSIIIFSISNKLYFVKKFQIIIAVQFTTTLCPNISSKNMLLNYSIFVNTSGFNDVHDDLIVLHLLKALIFNQYALHAWTIFCRYICWVDPQK